MRTQAIVLPIEFFRQPGIVFDPELAAEGLTIEVVNRRDALTAINPALRPGRVQLAFRF